MTPLDAALELQKRRRIRSSFQAWCEHALAPQGFTPAAHHRLLIQELEHVAATPGSRLMLFLPPGSAKSTYASDLFPAWWMAQKPNRAIIGASNTATLAESFSRRARGRVREHALTLGIGTKDEAVDLWTTDNGCQYRAAGVGGVITGLRADLAIIDDPVKSREEADSERQRQKTWEWFQDDLTTRLKPGASVVLVQTRWHEDDLAGRLLEAQPGRWKVITLPAQAESPDDPLGRNPGDWLWGDDAYGYAADMRLKAETADTRTWSALYQQRPAPDSGDYFKADWLHPVPSASIPPVTTMRLYGGSDYAVSEGKGDWTVHAVIGMDTTGRLWLLDLWRAQTSSDVWVQTFCDMVKQWKPIGWAEETGQIKSGVGPFLTRQMRESRAFVAREAFPTRGGDKSVRAQSIRGRMALGGLYYDQNAPWRKDLEAELMSFPAGKHDDQVDALGLIGQLLDKMIAGVKPQAKPRHLTSWDRAFGEVEETDSWRVA